MRIEFELTDQELKNLLEASRPQRAMYLSGGQMMGSSQQERANAAWEKLGKKYGFVYMTVEPIPGKSDRFFTAEVVGEVVS